MREPSGSPPRIPSLDIVSIDDLSSHSQLDFYALNMAQSDVDLLQGENAGLVKLDISRAEADGTLTALGISAQRRQ